LRVDALCGSFPHWIPFGAVLSIKDRGCQAAAMVYTSCGGAWFNGRDQAVLCLIAFHLYSSQGWDYNRFLTSVKSERISEYELDRCLEAPLTGIGVGTGSSDLW
jgi:hypothetical protein